MKFSRRSLFVLLLFLLLFLFLLAPDEAEALENPQAQSQQKAQNADAAKTTHQQQEEGKKKQTKSSTNALASSDHTKIPTGNIHQLFLECTVKHRKTMGEKESVLKTLYAHTALGTELALFYDNYYASDNQHMSYNAFVADRSLLKACQEDVSAAKEPAIKITGCKEKEGNSVSLTLDTVRKSAPGDGKKQKQRQDKLVLVPKSGSQLLGTCEGQLKGPNGQKTPYQIYNCTEAKCGDVKLVLTQRLNRFDIRQSYYAEKELKCLTKVCGHGRDIQEVFEKGADKKAPKRHKLFRECAVQRKDNNIETLVKFLPLNGQTLFFSKGEHIYVTQRTHVVRTYCEKAKAANLTTQIQAVEQAVLTLDGTKLMFKRKEKGKQMSPEELSLSVSGKGPSMNCIAFIKSATISIKYYYVFLWPKGMGGTGGHRLLLMRRRNTGSKWNLSKQQKMMDMMDGESVNVDRVFMVFGDIKMIRSVVQRCQGAISVVDGLTRSDGGVTADKWKKKKNKKKNKEKKNKENKEGKHEDDEAKDTAEAVNKKTADHEAMEGAVCNRQGRCGPASIQNKHEVSKKEEGDDGKKATADEEKHSAPKEATHKRKKEEKEEKKKKKKKEEDEHKGKAGDAANKNTADHEAMEGAVCNRKGRCGPASVPAAHSQNKHEVSPKKEEGGDGKKAAADVEKHSAPAEVSSRKRKRGDEEEGEKGKEEEKHGKGKEEEDKKKAELVRKHAEKWRAQAKKAKANPQAEHVKGEPEKGKAENVKTNTIPLKGKGLSKSAELK